MVEGTYRKASPFPCCPVNRECSSKNAQTEKKKTNWLNVNNICLNISKTEVALLQSPRTHADVPLTLLNSVKYLGIKLMKTFIVTIDF